MSDMRILSNRIFKAVLFEEVPEDIDIYANMKLCQDYFKASFKSNLFENEYALLFDFFNKYSNVTRLVSADLLLTELDRNKEVILGSSLIDMSKFTSKDVADSFVIFISSVMDVYDQISATSEIVEFEKFKLDIEAYKEEYKLIQTSQILIKAGSILHNGIIVGKGKLLKGVDDAEEFIQSSFSKLKQAISSSDNARGYAQLSEDFYNRMTTEGSELELVCKFGINAFDEKFGGFHLGEMLNIIGGTKAGKSRLTARMVHNALISGNRVAIWPLEMDKEREWVPLLRAIHFEYYWNSLGLHYPNISSDDIKKGKYYNESYKRYEYTSFHDLMTNYSLYMIYDDFNKETYKSIIEKVYNEKRISLIAIDYPGHAFNANEKSDLDGFYKWLLHYQKGKFASVLPSQLKAEIVTRMELGLDFSRSNAASDSAESVRSADINLILFASEEDRQFNKVKFFFVPSRTGGAWTDFYMNTRLGICEFTDIEAVV